MPLLCEIAAAIGLEVSPSLAGVNILRVSSVEEATPDSIVFATDTKLLARVLESQAGGALVNQQLRGGITDPRVLWVDNAKLAFARVAVLLRSSPASSLVHATAHVAEGALIGYATQVGAGAVIEEGVTLGAHCEIRANATIHSGTTIGDRVIVQAGAVLGSTGFGYVPDPSTGQYVAFPQVGTLVIEDDVEIGANSTIDRGALGETRVGRGTKIDNLVHIAHNCIIGCDVVIAAQTGISGSTVVGDGAVIGGQVGIGDHAEIGHHVILGSGSGVLSQKKLRGPGQVFWGIPAQPLRQYLRGLARLRRD